MKQTTKNLLRKITQWGVLVVIIAFFFKVFGNETFDPEAYCPFGGLQTFGTYMVKGSMACSMTATQIMMGVVLAVGIMLFSKLFCGYLCPLGTLSEYMGKLRGSLKIKEMVQMKSLQMPVHGGGVKTIDVNYKLVDVEPQIDTISRKEFLIRQFSAVNKLFSTSVEKYAGEKTSTYELIHNNLDKPIVSKNIPYLISYLSLAEGILGVQTLVNDNEQYAIRILYVNSILNEDKLWAILNAEKWNIKMKDGTVQESESKMKFSKQGVVLLNQN